MKAVVFDLGGVLVDWDPRYLYRQLLPSGDVERFLAEVTTTAWNHQQDVGRSWAEGVAELSGRFPEHAELIAAYHHRWAETIGGEHSDTVGVLRELRELGVALYALTNWSAETFPVARERFEWVSWFEGIVVSGEERLIKPDPRIYQVLLDRYGLDATATAYVDDNLLNVDAAAQLGFTALHFTGADRLRRELVGLGVLPAAG